jgi:hypothetical protein
MTLEWSLAVLVWLGEALEEYELLEPVLAPN